MKPFGWITQLRQQFMLRIRPDAPSASAGPAGRLPGLGAAALTLLLLLGGTVWMWRNVHEYVQRNAGEHFQFKVSEANFAIHQRLVAYEQILRGGTGLFAASREVERQEWHAYVDKLNINQNYPGIRGVGFSQRVPAAKLDAHIAAIRAEGFPQYTLRPAGERAEYTSIIYLEPFDWRNQRAFGYDMFSEPVRRSAMIRARDTGQPALSGRVKLVQETKQGVQYGFLIYIPVYRNGAPVQSLEQRRAALLGYVYAPFRMNDLMQGILGQEQLPNIRLQIFDGARSDPAQQLYDSARAQRAELAAPAYSSEQAFEFDGHRWTLRYSSLPAFEAGIDQLRPQLVLFGGILASLLFSAVMWSRRLMRARAQALAQANRALEQEVAERIALTAKLHDAKEAAEAANRAKGEFLANVSHELRTPLTLILAPLQQLSAAGHPTPDWKTQIERIERNALLLLNRVNDILDFSKAEADKFELRWQELDLTQLIPTLAEDARHAAQAKNCALSWQVDPALSTVCVDGRHFEKIMLNYLSNALKFTPSEGHIHLQAQAIDPQWFEFSVEDNGMGIPQEQQPLLFQRFQQLNTSATRDHGGTGLGLALVKQLAELMGGTAGVSSSYGHGARFFVRLPRGVERLVDPTTARQAPEPAPLDLALRRERLEEGAPLPRGTEPLPVAPSQPAAALPHVLVVDDNADMRTFIADLLRGECEVSTAANGRIAWKLLQHQCFDVVVSDVMMPELDGFGLTARIKQSEELAHVPVILVTARGGSEASSQGLEIGADDYIAKPFSAEELRARVRAALRMGTIQSELRASTRDSDIAVYASGLLHNLGNILNGVTVSASLLEDKLRHFKLAKVNNAAELLNEHVHKLPPRLQQLPTYLSQLTVHLEMERSAILKETETLRTCVEHALNVAGSHQQFSKPGAVFKELIAADSLMENALTLALNSFEMQDITLERHYDYTGGLRTDRHMALQILMNLLNNARHAVQRRAPGNRRLSVGTRSGEDSVQFCVSDNGEGIDPEHMTRLFDQGFTTKYQGHGYGLHSSANWARAMGGRLSAHSDGPGQGATFILTLPLPSLSEPAELLPTEQREQ